MTNPAGSFTTVFVFKTDRKTQEAYAKIDEKLRLQREKRREGEYQAYLRLREDGYVF